MELQKNIRCTQALINQPKKNLTNRSDEEEAPRMKAKKDKMQRMKLAFE